MPPTVPDDLAAGELLVDHSAGTDRRDDPCDPHQTELGVDSDLYEAGTEGAGGHRGVRGADNLATDAAEERNDDRAYGEDGESEEDGFRVVVARNSGYSSESLAVPINDLLRVVEGSRLLALQ